MKILMVCLGNICRSPMAEGILRSKIAETGLLWEIDSAGTSGWHNGELPDRRSIQTLDGKGINIRSQRSRQIIPKDLSYFDLILAMDAQNQRDIMALDDGTHADKVKMIMDFVPGRQSESIPDPYYNDRFDEVFDMLEEACEAIIKQYTNDE